MTKDEAVDVLMVHAKCDIGLSEHDCMNCSINRDSVRCFDIVFDAIELLESLKAEEAQND